MPSRLQNKEINQRLAELKAIAEGKPVLGARYAASSDYVSEALRMARKMLRKFASHLADTLGRTKYPGRRKLLDDAIKIVDRLKQDLPPNDLGADPLKPDPPHLSSILNAGWLFRVGHVEVENDPAEVSSTLDVVNRLVGKAIADAVVARDFRKWLADC